MAIERGSLVRSSSKRSEPCLDLLLMLLLLAAAPITLVAAAFPAGDLPGDRKSDGACCRVRPGQWDWALFEAPRTARIEQTVQYCP